LTSTVLATGLATGFSSLSESSSQAPATFFLGSGFLTTGVGAVGFFLGFSSSLELLLSSPNNPFLAFAGAV